jgi:ribosome-associated protein
MSSPTDNSLHVTESIQIPLSELEFSYARSSGPGGQNVNKVNSKVQLHWDLTRSQALPPEVLLRFRTLNRNRITTEGVFTLSSQRFRDQPKNRDDCLERLRELVLAASKAPKLRRPTKATRSSHRRRLQAKRERSERKAGRRQPRADD